MSYGRTFAEEFPTAYTEKYHTTTPRNMTTDWIGPRMYRPSLEEVLRGALAPSAPNVHYVTGFRYPSRGGFAAYLEKFVSTAPIQLGHEAAKIDARDKRIHFTNGRRDPLRRADLVGAFAGADRDDRGRAYRRTNRRRGARVLRMRSRQRRCRQTRHQRQAHPVLLRPRHPVLAPVLSPPDVGEQRPARGLEHPGRGLLLAEVQASRPKSEDLVDPVIHDLVRCGLIDDSDEILYKGAVLCEYANIIFDHDRESALETVHGFLEDVGIARCGRYGDWGYMWTDDSFTSGERAAEEVLRAERGVVRRRSAAALARGTMLRIRLGTGREMTPTADEVVVDVGIPTLSLSPFLLESIESVMAQTTPAWRLVISENGPGDDRLRAALEPYLADDRVTHVITGEKLDRGANYTRLIRTGTAPYVGLLHDDDRWGPTFLERHIEFLEEHGACGFVFSNFTAIDQDGRPIARSWPKIGDGVHPSAEIAPKLYRRMTIATPTVLARRSAYEAVGARYKEMIFTDHEMWVRLAMRFDVGHIATWDADYRFHSQQTSSSDVGQAKERLLVLDSLEDLPIPSRTRRVGRAEAYVWCALDCVEKGDRRGAMAELRNAIHTDRLALLRPSIGPRIAAVLGGVATGNLGCRDISAIRGGRRRTNRRRGISFESRMEVVHPMEEEQRLPVSTHVPSA